MNTAIKEAHKHTRKNRHELLASNMCGCIHCLKIFPSKSIRIWYGDAIGTGVCPFCGIDTLLGDASGFPITKEFLMEMQDYWV